MTTIVMSGAFKIVIVQHVVIGNKKIASRAMSVTSVDMAVKALRGRVVRSTFAANPVARAHVRVLLESGTRDKIALTAGAVIVYGGIHQVLL